MSYPEDDLERLEYSEQQQCYHRAKADDLQVPGWQIVCIAHPQLIDKFRMAHIELRGSFATIRQVFADFAGPFIMPDD